MSARRGRGTFGARSTSLTPPPQRQARQARCGPHDSTAGHNGSRADHLIPASQSERSPEKVAQVRLLDDANWGALGGSSPQRRGRREGKRKPSRRGKPVGLVMVSLSLRLVLYGHLAALLGRFETLDLF